MSFGSINGCGSRCGPPSLGDPSPWRSLPPCGAGLPLIAVVIAVNPIWGFSWYFNTENWASGFWQAVAARRTADWRAAMADSVIESNPSQTAQDLFRIAPSGVEGDFSFLVIGDPGEGDGSQWVLKDRFLELAWRDDVRFVIISSDVIYPDGAMDDYEENFFLPFKGVSKPIYAIPGNHDWFNALDAFAAVFFGCRFGPARAIAARVDEDLGFSSTTPGRIEQLISEAQRLADEYRLRVGLQKAPFFELQTPGFALLAMDTGVLKRLDPIQEQWVREALGRSRGKFVMALMGHPVFAAGADQTAGYEEFARLRGLLQEHRVPLVMAGDTHDFEYYREDNVGASGTGYTTHHFVNGGGGALSEHRQCSRQTGDACHSGLGDLPIRGRPDRQAGRPDSGLETTRLVVDQATQCLADYRGSTFGRFRFQWSPLLSELHGSPGAPLAG